MQRGRYSAQSLCTLTDFRASASVFATFMFINLNCDTTSGRIHQISYQDIADYLGYRVETVREAVAELARYGLIELEEVGDFQVTILQ